jgi:hypothetical protein
MNLIQFIQKDFLECEKSFINNNINGAKLLHLNTIVELRNIGIEDLHVSNILLAAILILKARVNKGFGNNYNYLNS